MADLELRRFVEESNKIERIYRGAKGEEIAELERFIALPKITIAELNWFVSVYQPNAKLRQSFGDDVCVSGYFPPQGGQHILEELQILLNKQDILNSYELHCEYEKLHPFTDCNGRSGRALWAWRHKDIREGFLIPFYFQSLKYYRNVK